MTTSIVFDSDGGVDDAAALWWACTHPDLEVVAVTAVAGNVGVEQAAINLATILDAAGHSHVPVAMGADQPVGPVPPIDRPKGIHGSDGLGDAAIRRVEYRPPAEDGPTLLGRLLGERPGELTVVATGPLTNLALALRHDSALAGLAKDLVVMGGSARRGGNVGPLTEANIGHDPQAAAEVVMASWSRPPLLVGLDVTLQATLSEAEFALLAEGRTAAARFLAAPMTFYRAIGGGLNDPGESPCHDLLAMMAAADESMVGSQVLPLQVDTGGSAAWGATVADFRVPALARRGLTPPGVKGAPWRIALDVDVDRFRSNVRRLFGDPVDLPD
jgi:purine nucleosidase